MTVTFGNLFTPSSKLEPEQEKETVTFPEGYLDDPAIATIIRAISTPGPRFGGVYVISGRAGTGKSTFVRYLQSLEDIKTIVVAPTNLAAVNIDGATIHKTFELPFGIIDSSKLFERPLRQKKVLANIQRIIIDEASMVRCDILDAIDARLKEVKNSRDPFGGVQIILIGDPLQLPPVATPETEKVLAALGYETKYFFSSHSIRDLPANIYTIDKVWRQQSLDFVDILSDIRIHNRRTIDDKLRTLNAACVRSHRANHTPVLLVPTNDKAQHYNRENLRAHMNENGYTNKDILAFAASVQGSFETGDSKRQSPKEPAQRSLKLVPGCRVMLNKNLKNHELYNGRLGKFFSIEKETRNGRIRQYLLVHFDGMKHPTRVHKATWKDIKYSWNAKTGRVEEDTKGTFTQFPVSLAYAITIHKSQGMTLSDVRLDTATGAFEYGQTYVALSRATSMQGLSLVNPLTTRDIKTDPDLLELLMRARRTPHYNILKV